nr:MAG TPA: hypothetical protein [Caudoviricetes sp.]
MKIRLAKKIMKYKSIKPDIGLIDLVITMVRKIQVK